MNPLVLMTNSLQATVSTLYGRPMAIAIVLLPSDLLAQRSVKEENELRLMFVGHAPSGINNEALQFLLQQAADYAPAAVVPSERAPGRVQ